MLVLPHVGHKNETQNNCKFIRKATLTFAIAHLYRRPLLLSLNFAVAYATVTSASAASKNLDALVPFIISTILYLDDVDPTDHEVAEYIATS